LARAWAAENQRRLWVSPGVRRAGGSPRLVAPPSGGHGQVARPTQEALRKPIKFLASQKLSLEPAELRVGTYNPYMRWLPLFVLVAANLTAQQSSVGA
jgi:hypothetical protein